MGTGPSAKGLSATRPLRLLSRVLPALAIISLFVAFGIVGWLRAGADAAVEAIGKLDVASFPDDMSARMADCDYHWLVACAPWPKEKPHEKAICLLFKNCGDGSALTPRERRELDDWQMENDWGLAGRAWLFVKAVPRAPDAAIHALAIRWHQGFIPAAFMAGFLALSVLVPLVATRGNPLPLPLLWPFSAAIVLLLMFLLQAICWAIAEAADYVLIVALCLGGGAVTTGRDGIEAIRAFARWRKAARAAKETRAARATRDALLKRSEDFANWVQSVEEATRRDGAA
jgi:hypothetical protein